MHIIRLELDIFRKKTMKRQNDASPILGIKKKIHGYAMEWHVVHC